jgi:AcrR family transcriptional regulator
MDMKNGRSSTTRGRPRSFNAEQALDRALRVFWKKGYEGASLSDLTKAMGINRPSLYAAFGDKRGLFSKVLDRYVEESGCRLQEALQEPTARAFAERLLRGAARSMCSTGHPPGCLLVQGALASGDAADSVRRELISRRHADEMTIRNRLKRAKEEGDLSADSDPNALAQYLKTVLHGMAVDAASGAGPSKLQRVAEVALRAWPQ